MNGLDDLATADPETLRRWWSFGDLSVGLAPRGAFVAIDIDRRRHDDETFHHLERRLGELPVTPTWFDTGLGRWWGSLCVESETAPLVAIGASA